MDEVTTDIMFDGLSECQKIGIMMSAYTKSVIFQYVEEKFNFPKNKLMSSISTEKKHRCPIIVDDEIPLLELRICLIQPLDLR